MSLPLPGSWSADGTLLAFTAKPPVTSFDVWLADFSAAAPGRSGRFRSAERRSVP